MRIKRKIADIAPASASTVDKELQKLDKRLLKQYDCFTNAVLEALIDAGYSIDMISKGLKNIGLKLSTKEIEKRVVGNLDESEVILAYYRSGYSVSSISKKFGRSIYEINSRVLSEAVS